MRNALLAVLVLAAPAAALAKGDQGQPAFFGPHKPKVGRWAQYSFSHVEKKAVKSKGVYKWSVVGKDGDAFWFENTYTVSIPKPKHGSGAGAMKMLVKPGEPRPRKMYMKTDRGVMDMTAMMAHAGTAPSHKKPDLHEEGTETITVPAGTFKTVKYTFKGDKDKDVHGTLWAKEGTGPYGVVKTVTTHKDAVMTMELMDSGDGAKSEIDESQARSMFSGRGAPAGGQGGDDEGGAPARPSMADIMKAMQNRKR